MTVHIQFSASGKTETFRVGFVRHFFLVTRQAVQKTASSSGVTHQIIVHLFSVSPAFLFTVLYYN
jgi:hypothetical protein